MKLNEATSFVHKSSRAVGHTDTILGQRLKAARLKIGKSQEQLAAEIGVTYQQIQKYEKGLNRVSSHRLIQLARALKRSVDFLLSDVEIAPNEAELFMATEEGIEIIQTMMAMSKKQQRQVIKIAKVLAEDDVT